MKFWRVIQHFKVLAVDHETKILNLNIFRVTDYQTLCFFSLELFWVLICGSKWSLVLIFSNFLKKNVFVSTLPLSNLPNPNFICGISLLTGQILGEKNCSFKIQKILVKKCVICASRKTFSRSTQQLFAFLIEFWRSLFRISSKCTSRFVGKCSSTNKVKHVTFL